MFLTFGVFIDAVLLVAALWLVYHVIGRFPSDAAELRAKYREYRSRNDPEVMGRMESEERRRNHRQRCVMEFSGALIADAFFWSLTIFAGFFAFGVIVRIIRGIASAL